MNRRDFFKRLIAATAILPLSRTVPAIENIPGQNWIDLPRETGDITALVPYRDSVLAFTERAVYRIDCVGQPWRFDGRRFRATRMDADLTRVVKERYL